jgi:hypothetical protein
VDDRDGYAIGRLADASLIQDRIVVGDRLSGDVRFYDYSGQLTSIVGRRGSGPGEFRALRRLARVSSTAVAAWDVQLQRITIVEEGSAPQAVLPGPVEAQSTFPEFIGAISTNAFVFRDRRGLMGMRNVPTGALRDSITYLVVDSTGETRATLRRRGDEEWLYNQDRRWAREPILFGTTAAATVAGETLILGETDHLEFTLVDSAGRSSGSVVLEHQPTSIPTAAIERERSRQLDASVAAQNRMPLISAEGRPVVWDEWYSKMYRLMPAATEWPAYTALYGDRDGFWFCLDMDAVAQSTCSRVQGSSITGVVNLPGEWEIHAFHKEHVLISTVDDLDLRTVQLYRLVNAAQ